MIRRFSAIALAVFLTGVFSSCILDPKEDPAPPVVDQKENYKPLTSPENVMFNFQKAYNERNHARYTELLDPEFIFFFSAGDVGGDPPIPEYWDYNSEVNSAGNMFDPNWVDPDPDNPEPPISKIVVTVSFAGVTWASYVDPAYSTEVWKRATMRYDYHIFAGDNEYIVGTDPQAELTCRPVKVDDGAGGFRDEWRLIRWRDLGFENG
jgi:hypothetical protein